VLRQFRSPPQNCLVVGGGVRREGVFVVARRFLPASPEQNEGKQSPSVRFIPHRYWMRRAILIRGFMLLFVDGSPPPPICLLAQCGEKWSYDR
jgi:hypothetical protein